VLKYTRIENPGHVMDSIIEQIRRLYRKELVHADMSEYNVLVKDGEPYMIDFGQAVDLRHPNAMMFLKRDVNNILQYFSKHYGIEKDLDSTLRHVTGAKPGAGKD
jgi:serine/threonine-protein kinase RIO1